MKVIAIANQKGGVGKTTISLAVATAMADLVRGRTLVIDLDTQANATVGLGQPVDPQRPGLTDWLVMRRSLSNVAVRIRERLDLVPGSSLTEDVNLSLSTHGRLDALKAGLNGASGSYDLVIIDCPPNLSMITRSGICAARYVLVPVDCEAFSLQGVATIAGVIRQLQEAGSRVKWLGVIPNKYRIGVGIHERNIDALRRQFGKGFVWDPLPMTVQIAGAQQRGLTIWAPGAVDGRHKAAWAGMVKRLLSYE